MLRWQPLETTGQLPSPRAGHTAAFVKNRVIVFGGFGGGAYLNDIHVLELGDDTFFDIFVFWFFADSNAQFIKCG